MCAVKFQQMTPRLPPPPGPARHPTTLAPAGKPIHPTHIPTPPRSGQHTMFSPRLACHLLVQGVRMDMIGRGQSQIMPSVLAELWTK